MYEKMIAKLIAITEQLVKSEVKLDRKCSSLSSLCRTLLSGMRDSITHDTMDYDQRNRKEKELDEIFKFLKGEREKEIESAEGKSGIENDVD